jgi:hypothetical protein
MGRPGGGTEAGRWSGVEVVTVGWESGDAAEAGRDLSPASAPGNMIQIRSRFVQYEKDATNKI